MTLKIAFIGCGRIFDLNIQGYLNNPDAIIVAISDLNSKLIDEKLEIYGKIDPRMLAIKKYSDYIEMIQTEKPDIVEILTPHHIHKSMVLKCAELGVPAISLQKPMALNTNECHVMIEACKKSRTKFKVYENFVYYPPYQKAKELLDSGIIGESKSIRVLTLGAAKGGWSVPLTTWLWRIKAETCGGGPQVFDDGFHKFSAAMYFIGIDVESVYGWIDEYGFIDAPAQIIFKFKHGNEKQKMGIVEFQTMTCGTIKSPYYSCDEFIEIVGTNGIMVINQCTSGGTNAGNPMGTSSDFPAIRVIKNDKITDYGADLDRDWAASFKNSTMNFVQCVKDNSDDFLYSGEIGLELTKFAKAPYYSQLLKREIRLDEITEEFEVNPEHNINHVFSFGKFLRHGICMITSGKKIAKKYSHEL